MGIEEVAGGVLVLAGVINVSRALPLMVRARRSPAPSARVPADVWSGLCAGLGLLASGVLYLLYPGYPRGTWLAAIPAALAGASLALLIAPWVMSRMKARHLRLGSASAPGLGSADLPGPEPAAGTTNLIERIKNVQFGTTRLAAGYDEEEVDAFLDKLVAALSQDGQVDRSELRDVRFGTTRLRPGYLMPDVDGFLEEVAQATW